MVVEVTGLLDKYKAPKLPLISGVQEVPLLVVRKTPCWLARTMVPAVTGSGEMSSTSPGILESNTDHVPAEFVLWNRLSVLPVMVGCNAATVARLVESVFPVT